MHESILVVLMLITPTSGTSSRTWDGFTYGGSYPTVEACEKMATKLSQASSAYAKKKGLSDGPYMGHVCSDEPVKK